MSLKEAALRLQASLGAGRAIERVTCEEEEGTVSLTVHRSGGQTSRVRIQYADPTSYPNSAACFALADNNDGLLSDSLSMLSEQQFQEHAPLERVVAELLKVYGVQADGSSNVAGSSGTGAALAAAPPKKPAARGDSDDEMDAQSDDECGYDGMDASGGGDDDEEAGADDEDEDEEEDEEEREMMINCGKRQGRWERHEERVREAEGAAGAAGEKAATASLSHEQASAKKQQIFEPREAFMMLSKELLHILRKQSFDMFVDSVGDDVYAWSVELGSFDPASNLYKDMVEVQKRYQYSFVKLVLKFKRGLHPFYPPSVEVVRPHMQGCIATAMASHPVLKLGNWDPWRPVEELIKHLKAFLQAGARVDLDHPMNNISRYPVSSYRPVEVALARLNALSNLDLLCPNEPQIQELFNSCAHNHARLEALASESSKKRTREAPKDAKTVWARGTGYGSGDRSNQDPVWDARASEAAQRARDEELRCLLESLAADVSYDLQVKALPMLLDELNAATAAFAAAVAAAAGAAAAAAPAASAAFAASAAASAAAVASSSSAPDAAAQLTAMAVDDPLQQQTTQHVDPDAAACLAALGSSCLMRFLVQELKSASFTDMCSRTPFYMAVLGLCKVMGHHPDAAKLLWQPVADGASTAGLVLAMRDSAKLYQRVTRPVYDKEMEEQRASAAALAAAQAGSSAALKMPVSALQQETLQELLGGLQLAANVQDVAGLLAPHKPAEAPAGAAGAASTSAAAGAADGAGPSSSSGAGAGPSGSSGSSDSLYCQTLRPLQVEYISDLRNASHAYANSANSEGVQPKARMSRLAKEIAGLQQLLPLNECSSIFVRVDEENVTMWRALIIGPEDTPYSCGCFIFDFYFPPNYPSVPPQVLFKTTGGGRVRMNPNLYHNGKVCLSLLGTWEGARGEGWNATASSALQVLLSIQSLILVPQPYFNEPGFERQHNSEEGAKQSREYNKDITEGTLRYAMIDLLQHPPKELEAVIKAHFKLRQQAVQDTVQGWITAAEQWSSSHASTLKGLLAQLTPLLAKL